MGEGGSTSRMMLHQWNTREREPPREILPEERDAYEEQCWEQLRDENKAKDIDRGHKSKDLRNVLSEKRYMEIRGTYEETMKKEAIERKEREEAEAAIKRKKPKMTLSSALMKKGDATKSSSPRKKRVKKASPKKQGPKGPTPPHLKGPKIDLADIGGYDDDDFIAELGTPHVWPEQGCLSSTSNMSAGVR